MFNASKMKLFVAFFVEEPMPVVIDKSMSVGEIVVSAENLNKSLGNLDSKYQVSTANNLCMRCNCNYDIKAKSIQARSEAKGNCWRGRQPRFAEKEDFPRTKFSDKDFSRV